MTTFDQAVKSVDKYIKPVYANHSGFDEKTVESLTKYLSTPSKSKR